jgi:agmatinase
VYGPISVIHFDSHLDTWKPSVFGGAPSSQAAINHGTYFYWASQEGLIRNGSSIASILFPSPINTFLLSVLCRTI